MALNRSCDQCPVLPCLRFSCRSFRCPLRYHARLTRDVCGGDGSLCRDCLGVSNGPAVYDLCDVCGGDGSTCRDCLGVPNGAAVYDVCEVCDGDGLSCLDCDGVPFGTKVVDACRVCGGSASTCAACCTSGLTCASISATCGGSEFPVETEATTCSNDLCCPRASSAFNCPLTSNSIKIIAYVDVSGTLEARTICVNGWLGSDGSGLAGRTETRTLSVNSSDGSFFSTPTPYNCVFGPASSTGFPVSFGCVNGANEIAYFECALFCLSNSGSCNGRKRQSNTIVGSTASFALASNGRGDPHLVGPEGVKYKFGGVANGTYALFTAPAFVVNMQLAASGPLNRFMTSVGVVLDGEAVTITPQLRRDAAALTKFFEAHGASVAFKEDDVGSMTVTLCTDHALTIEARSLNAKFDYLNVAVSVPGCHDSYGGALGQTYRCEYVSGAKPFVWSHAQEESFRVKSLGTPSGTYSPKADCAHEDEFQGQQPFTGGSTTTPDGAVTMRHGSAPVSGGTIAHN